MTAYANSGSGPPGHFVLGSLLEFRRDVLSWLERCASEYGDFVPIRLVTRQGYLVSNLAAIADILVHKHTDFCKVHFLRDNRLFLGQGLLTSEGAAWRLHRKWVQPAFHAERLAEYSKVIAEEASIVAHRWRNLHECEMQADMARLTLRTLVRCLFGPTQMGPTDADVIARCVGVLQERMKERYQALVPLPDTAWIPRNVKLRRAIRELDGLVYRMIAERRRASSRSTDLLSMLIDARDDAGRGMSDREIRDEVVTMLFAGHETTALTLSWSWYLLSENEDKAAALRKDVVEALGSRLPGIEDVPRLRAAAAVIKEAQRLYPPVYAYGRESLRTTVVGGFRVQAGQSLIISPWVLHRQSRFFAAPLEFSPDRWTQEFERALPPFAYSPFGGGARRCVGKDFAMLEAVLILAILVREFHPRLRAGHAVELWPTFTLRSRTGMPMTLTPVH